MSLRPVREVIRTKATVEGAGVKLQRAFGFGQFPRVGREPIFADSPANLGLAPFQRRFEPRGLGRQHFDRERTRAARFRFDFGRKIGPIRHGKQFIACEFGAANSRERGASLC